jgi:DNA-binding transcriptional ArsR family regulator
MEEKCKSAVASLLDSIPSEVRSTIKLLSDDTRFAIVLILLKEGSKSFSELAMTLGVPKNALSHHLKVLSRAALIKNYYAKRDGIEDFSFYGSTDLSKDFLEKLFADTNAYSKRVKENELPINEDSSNRIANRISKIKAELALIEKDLAKVKVEPRKGCSQTGLTNEKIDILLSSNPDLSDEEIADRIGVNDILVTACRRHRSDAVSSGTNKKLVQRNPSLK